MKIVNAEYVHAHFIDMDGDHTHLRLSATHGNVWYIFSKTGWLLTTDSAAILLERDYQRYTLESIPK